MQDTQSGQHALAVHSPVPHDVPLSPERVLTSNVSHVGRWQASAGRASSSRAPRDSTQSRLPNGEHALPQRSRSVTGNTAVTATAWGYDTGRGDGHGGPEAWETQRDPGIAMSLRDER